MKNTVATYLDALGFTAQATGFIEFRARAERGMRQHFLPIRDRAGAVELVERVGCRADLYMGVAPRDEMRGGREAITAVHALWADCDSPEALAALERFRPSPALVVSSGNGQHAYWPLETATSPGLAEQSNKRLAQALGADAKATDAARILRPPSSLNFKSSPPKPVEIVHLAVDVFRVGDVVGSLPPVESRKTLPRLPRTFGGTDILMQIPATVYVPALTGREVYIDGKVSCPFHNGGQERTPSLHVYDDPGRGWYCYGCEDGGTIVDFGARLFAIEPRGEGFRELRERLEAALLTTLRSAA